MKTADLKGMIEVNAAPFVCSVLRQAPPLPFLPPEVHGDSNFVMNVHGSWTSPDDDPAGVAWTREVYHGTLPFATGGVYSNFLTAEETDRVQPAFGSNDYRLVQVKKAYDPENFFRLNQNIRPDKAPQTR